MIVLLVRYLVLMLIRVLAVADIIILTVSRVAIIRRQDIVLTLVIHAPVHLRITLLLIAHMGLFEASVLQSLAYIVLLRIHLDHTYVLNSI